MAPTADLIKYLTDNHVAFNALSHVPTHTSRAVAMANHVSEECVSTVRVFRALQKYWLAVLPGNSQLNIDELRRLLSADVSPVSDWDVERLFPECESGALPPFGKLYGMNVIADATFQRTGRMVFNACCHTVSIAMDWSAFERLEHPQIAQIVESADILEEGAMQ